MGGDKAKSPQKSGSVDLDLLLSSKVKLKKNKQKKNTNNTAKFPFNKQSFPRSTQQIETHFVDSKQEEHNEWLTSSKN